MINIKFEKQDGKLKVELDDLPKTLKDLEELPKDYFKTPEYACAMFIAIMTNYEKDKEETYKMLDYINGPGEISTYDKQFLRDRMVHPYKINSYFEGSSPDNDYHYEKPYILYVSENPYTYKDDGYATFYMQSSGADSPRPISVRQKKSTGEWFLNDQMLLSDIRVPKSDNPWS